jgi:hypothetical protein
VAVAVGPNAVTAAGATSALPAAIGVTVS